MKNIAKHTLLFGAFALLSSMPLQAMEGAPADVQREVKTKQGFFARLTAPARKLKLKHSMRELTKAWNPFITCVEKGHKDCSKQAQTVRAIIKTILALVVVGGVAAAVAGVKRSFGRGRKPAYTVDENLLITRARLHKESRFNEARQRALETSLGIIRDGEGQIMEQPTKGAAGPIAYALSEAALREAADILQKGYYYKRVQELLEIKTPTESVRVEMR